MSTKKLTLLSLFAVLSLAVYAIESAIPPLVPLPGIKLGLANVITLILLRRFTWREAGLVLAVRIALSALLFGQALSLLYSLAGGFFSLLVMAAAMKLLNEKMICLVGASGGLCHNLAQLLTALAITATPGVAAYLPFLVLSGVLAGLFTGLCAGFADKYLPHVPPS